MRGTESALLIRIPFLCFQSPPLFRFRFILRDTIPFGIHNGDGALCIRISLRCGVVKPFEKKLEIIGVGYNANLAGTKLTLQVGFANKIVLEVPPTVKCEVPDATHVIVKSSDRQACGQFAADIRAVRPPEPYKGKGIRYQDEFVRRKSGKAFGSK